MAKRISNIFSDDKNIGEKKMFGGIAYMYKDHMCVGIVDDMLMVRVGSEQYEKALSEKYVRPMDFTGKPMKGYVYVEPKAIKSEKSLRTWIDKGIAFANTLPPKKPRK
ncbi:MAG: TfoX/Sxy family protein [Thermodesulfobacteriota bacterium]